MDGRVEWSVRERGRGLTSISPYPLNCIVLRGLSCLALPWLAFILLLHQEIVASTSYWSCSSIYTRLSAAGFAPISLPRARAASRASGGSGRRLD